MFTPRRQDALRFVAAAAVLLATVGSGLAAPAGKSGRDKAPPTITISGAQQTTASTVMLSGTANDNVGVAAVDVRVDAGSYVLAQGTTSWSYSMDTSILAPGTHTATARARDAAGNTATASVSFTVAPAVDATPPSATITAPTANASVNGSVTVTGTASDNRQLAKVDVSVDNGSYQPAEGTSSWSASVDTSGLANGSHTINARATDTSGNVGVASETVDVLNDVAPPSVSIATPAAGATVSGPVSVTGIASDDVAVASVAVTVDGGPYAAAQGTASWSYTLDTTTLSNGSHTLTVRAADSSGKSTTASVTVSVSNSLPAGYSQKLVTPEGATILVASDVSNWTAQQIYDLLKPNAYQLALIGPHLTIRVQTAYNTFTTTSAGTSGGVYTSFNASMYLNASSNSLLLTRPDATITHEYGAVWSMYHLYLTEQGNWNPWLTERGLLGNPLLDSSDVWSRGEMIADDYRMLFGTQAAQDQMSYENPDIPDPRAVWGLKDFFVNTWGA